MATSVIDLENLDDVLPHGFSVPAIADDPEIHVCLPIGGDLIALSLVTGAGKQVTGRLTASEAVRLAMALIALAESNR